MKVLIIGAGWAGLAAAVEATRLGHNVTVLEAARDLGGRARALKVQLPNGTEATLDNGQHILIGAYSETLKLMQDMGVDTAAALHRLPLTLRYPDGSGLALPDWHRPWFAGVDVAAGIVKAKGWTLGDKLSLLRAADAWRRSRFTCPAHYTVAQLCQGLSPRVMQQMIEPLVVSALNITAQEASASVYLRVMHDALFAPSKGQVAGSNMLLPRTDLAALLPIPAQRWLGQRGVIVQPGERVTDLGLLLKSELTLQHFLGQKAQKAQKTPPYDAIVLATPPAEAARLVRTLQPAGGNAQAATTSAGASAGASAAATQAAGHIAAWAHTAAALQYTAITTVYAYSQQAQLTQLRAPVMALPSTAQQPAQFVFDRGALSGYQGLLAFVVSASEGDAASLEQLVIAQGRSQLGLADLQPVKTIVEKRATFACTPGLQRPSMQVAQGVLACGDYVDGPYPATLEGAVRSGLAAARALPV